MRICSTSWLIEVLERCKDVEITYDHHEESIEDTHCSSEAMWTLNLRFHIFCNSYNCRKERNQVEDGIRDVQH